MKVKLLEDVDHVLARNPGWFENAAISLLVNGNGSWKGMNQGTLQNMLVEVNQSNGYAIRSSKITPKIIDWVLLNKNRGGRKFIKKTNHGNLDPKSR